MNKWDLKYSKQMETILKILLSLIHLPNFQKNCPKFITAKAIIGHGIPEIKGANKTHDVYGTKFFQKT